MSQKPNKKRALASQSGVASPSPIAAPTAGPAPVSLSTAEETEPQVDSAAMPVWLLVLLMALVYWGMLHLDHYGGGFNERVYGPYVSYRQLADLQVKSGPEMLIARGEAIYAMVCIACHQATGTGSPGLYPPLAGSEWVVGSPSRLIRIPLHGVTGVMQVRGEPWVGSMPAFGGAPPLDDDENLAAVLSYIRNAWGNEAEPISPEQVRAVREETASRTTQWTAEELLRIPE